MVLQCIKVALACGLAWWLGPFFHLSHPFNAVLAVIILMQGNAYGSLLNSMEFLLGVAAGLVLGIGAHLLLGISPLVMAGMMLVCLLLGGWIKVSSQGFNNQIAISALLVLASGSASNVGRLWETVLGGAVGVLVAAVLWPPNPVSRLRQQFRDVRAQLQSDVLRSVELAGRGDPAAAEESRRSVREHSERSDAAVTEIGAAEEALRWNPWHGGRMQDLCRLEDRLRLISYLYRTVRALARQSAETPRPDPEDRPAWEVARPELRTAGGALVEAIDRRLTGQDARDPITQARAAVSRFARAVHREHHAVALAAVLDDALNDVEGWRPENQVDPDRQLVTRILRRLGRRPSAAEPLVAEGHIEFEEELDHARLRDLTGALTGNRRRGPGFDDIVEAAGVTSEVERGVREIPLALIKGSERQDDFDVSFLPRSHRLRMEWIEVYVDMEEGRPVAPIDVYQLGDAYYVKHGHHRVSVARRLGRDEITAHVAEVVTRAPVGSDVSAHELLDAAEYATFLERTELDKVRPEARLACSQLGRYDLLTDHILGHCYFLGVQRGYEVSVPEAATSWYDSVYQPLIQVARAHAIHERLASWTDTDIYLALTRLWLDLDGEGRPAGPEQAAKALLADPARVPAPPGSTPRWRGPWQLVRRLAR
jgi:uncharacterized membrane protein YgaE (UPF0421/DUF939 family)